MPKISVKARIGDTIHPKYGLLVKGQEYTIEKEEFGEEIFERPVVSGQGPGAGEKTSKKNKEG